VRNNENQQSVPNFALSGRERSGFLDSIVLLFILSLKLNLPPLSDEDLVLNAEEIFLEHDRTEDNRTEAIA